MKKVYVSYNAESKQVTEAYSDEEFAIEPFLEVDLSDWENAYLYGMQNISVSDDLKTLVGTDTRTLDEIKASMILDCSSIATTNITAVYPIYKQINLQSEASKQSTILAVGLGKNIPDIQAPVYALILKLKTVSAALKFRANIPTMDLTAYVSSVAADAQPSLILAYRKLLTCLIADKLKEFIQVWCNDKQATILACATKTEVKTINLSDCPIITE